MTMFVSSCSDDDNDYTAGKPAGKYDVSFVEETAKLALALSDDKFEVTLARANGDGELTVPVEVLDKPDFMSVPSSVTFAAGETEKSFEVTIGEGMENFVNYNVRLRIPEEYTSPYKEDAGSPMFNLVVLKEDYKPYAAGVFTDNILFKQDWDQILEYSEIMDIYRFPDLIAAGTHFYFKWNGESGDDSELYFCDADGKKVTKFASGYVHSNYGMIYANILDAWMGFDADDNAFYFPMEFNVSEGSFGQDYETFEIVEKY